MLNLHGFVRNNKIVSILAILTHVANVKSVDSVNIALGPDVLDKSYAIATHAFAETLPARPVHIFAKDIPDHWRVRIGDIFSVQVFFTDADDAAVTLKGTATFKPVLESSMAVAATRTTNNRVGTLSATLYDTNRILTVDSASFRIVNSSGGTRFTHTTHTLSAARQHCGNHRRQHTKQF